jgi:hypothetical protein
MAKLQREQALVEKRLRKQERKNDRRQAAAEESATTEQPLDPVEEERATG